MTLTENPEDAYRYLLGYRSAIEWIIDRYQVKIDKASGIVNDPNDWSVEATRQAARISHFEGIDPGFTGELSTIEYLDKIRGAS